MSLTSRDETDLLLPLYQGVHEEPPFQTFLDRLRRRTRAEYVGLSVRKEDSPLADATIFHSGIDLHGRARELGIEELYMLDGVHRSSLRPFRVYSVAEFTDHDPAYRDRRARSVARLGIADERIVRVSEDSSISAWLVLARSGTCSAADSALLSNLAPYVATVLTSLNLIEKQRISAALSAEGLARLGVGWILFDTDARILDIESGSADILAKVLGSEARIGERLRQIGLHAERALGDAAALLVNDPDAMPSTVVISEEPRIDAVLVSARYKPGGSGDVPIPAMVAYLRFAGHASPHRAQGLAGLFGLPQREAELAIALSDGNSIAEAANAMGLTLETARNYSKRLYAKLGVRGQAELVRLVLRSSAVLA